MAPKTVQKLEDCAERLKKTRAEVVEQGIDMVYETLEPQNKKDNE